MDHYSILDQGSPDPGSDLPLSTRGSEPARGNVPPGTASSLRFPAEDGGKSLSDMAQRDLTVALQLLAERAQYITGASGAAIALREGEELICRARAGASAPEVGAHLQVSSGLTGESVRTREILRCYDASTDARVNHESCKELGIASVMVMPLLRDQEVTGVFELLSDRPHAFEERDIIALQRLGEMIGTAIDHAEAVKRGIEGASAPTPTTVDVPVAKEVVSKPEVPVAPVEPIRSPLANIGKCQTCGFPVSGSRTLCLDCEGAQHAADPASRPAAPAFLGELDAPRKSWLREHMYTIGIVLMAVLTGVLLLWLRPI
jgi:putative methionine-R-sulfoxide reductase with GAF domain